MLRKTYVHDDKTLNIEKVKAVTFEGTSPEEYFQTLVNFSSSLVDQVRHLPRQGGAVAWS